MATTAAARRSWRRPTASVTLAAVAPNAVSYWSDVATATANGTATVTSTAEESNPVFSVDLATVHVAMYDAATAIDGRYKPYAITPTATTTAGASIPAAIGAAAYGVLKVLYPDYSALYANAYTSFVASIPEGDAKVRGLAIGAEVATRTVALRANDGRSVTLAAYAPGTAPGIYSGPAIYRFAGSVKPFVLTSMSQFRPAGPPLLTSTTYAADYNEIKALGVAAGSTRTAVQTDQALFWNEFPGTRVPAQLLPARAEHDQRRRRGAPARVHLRRPGGQHDGLLRGQVRVQLLAARCSHHARRRGRQRRHDQGKRPGFPRSARRRIPSIRPATCATAPASPRR